MANLFYCHKLSDEIISQNLCDVLKRALKTLLDDFTPLIEPVSVLIAEMYQTCPNTPALDMAKQVLLYTSLRNMLLKYNSLFHFNYSVNVSIKYNCFNLW